MNRRVKLRWNSRVHLTVLFGLCVAVALAYGSKASLKPANAESSNPAIQGDTLRFTLTGRDARQHLKVRERPEGTIEVSIAVQQPCTRRESGIATPSPEKGDLEIEVDPSGEGYPVDTFFLEVPNGCTIRIGLAVEDRVYAWLQEWGCNSVCPLSTMAMTRQ